MIEEKTYDDYLKDMETLRTESAKENKKRSDLTSYERELVEHELHRVGICKSAIDNDPLRLIYCIIAHCENRDAWREKSDRKDQIIAELKKELESIANGEHLEHPHRTMGGCLCDDYARAALARVSE